MLLKGLKLGGNGDIGAPENNDANGDDGKADGGNNEGNAGDASSGIVAAGRFRDGNNDWIGDVGADGNVVRDGF